MNLTEEQKVAYLNGGWRNCPYCNSVVDKEFANHTDGFKADGDFGHQIKRCNICGGKWQKVFALKQEGVYELKDIEEVE